MQITTRRIDSTRVEELGTTLGRENKRNEGIRAIVTRYDTSPNMEPWTTLAVFLGDAEFSLEVVDHEEPSTGHFVTLDLGGYITLFFTPEQYAAFREYVAETDPTP